MGNSAPSKRKVFPRYFHNGSIGVGEELKQLANCKATVKEIAIYETRMSEKLWVNHHYLLLTVSTLLSEDGAESPVGSILIRAEKYANVEGPTINVKQVHFFGEQGSTPHLRHKIQDLFVTISMDRLLSILCNHDAEYDLLTRNCWKYADDTFRDLLRVFASLRSQAANTIRDNEQQLPLVMYIDRMKGHGWTSLVCAGILLIILILVFVGKLPIPTKSWVTEVWHVISKLCPGLISIENAVLSFENVIVFLERIESTIAGLQAGLQGLVLLIGRIPWKLLFAVGTGVAGTSAAGCGRHKSSGW